MQISVVWKYLVSCSCFDCGSKIKPVDSVHSGVCLVILWPRWIDIVLSIFQRNTSMNHWTFTLCLEYTLLCWNASEHHECLPKPWKEIVAFRDAMKRESCNNLVSRKPRYIANDLSCFSLWWCVTTHCRLATLNCYNVYWLTVPYRMQSVVAGRGMVEHKVSNRHKQKLKFFRGHVCNKKDWFVALGKPSCTDLDVHIFQSNQNYWHHRLFVLLDKFLLHETCQNITLKQWHFLDFG